MHMSWLGGLAKLPPGSGQWLLAWQMLLVATTITRKIIIIIIITIGAPNALLPMRIYRTVTQHQQGKTDSEYLGKAMAMATSASCETTHISHPISKRRGDTTTVACWLEGTKHHRC